ncbi:uncharacterized protein B0H18DRAFT_1210530 [Fomitopsis serialis]|uniref:uncharacterized protein n=1 Tax=Fomitopsis serialis TaxID=139415 RepID=UPI0020084D74|nr:uncharacterized protein B0H18DRAFT_1210530 [Neoantrodia serialis]KAH9927810.1 hypothetical protein B0H18DRAFT_1210530 [Neoantrodia serialis]
MRRRGLLSGIHLVLPKTPLPPPTPNPGHTPQTSLTFTAELDASGRGFLFTPVSDEPMSAPSPQSTQSPVPDDIDGETNDIEPEPPAAEPCRPGSPSSRSSASSVSSRSSALFNHERKRSDTSTCPSSVMEDQKPFEDPISPAAEETINMLESELHRTALMRRSKSFDHSCFACMDDELLLDPWQAFDSLCWTASVDQFPDTHRAFPLSPAVPVARPRADVPEDTISASIVNFKARTSHFSADDQKLTVAAPVRASRIISPLHMHISTLKAFRFPRRKCK